jgi:hypothetical protein
MKKAGVKIPPAEAGTAPAKEQAEGSADDAGSGNGSANGGVKPADDSANVDAVLLEQSRQQIRTAGDGRATSTPSEQAEWDRLESGKALETTDDGRPCL